MKKDNNYFAAVAIVGLAADGAEHINEDDASNLDAFFAEDGTNFKSVRDEIDELVFASLIEPDVEERAHCLFDEYVALYDLPF